MAWDEEDEREEELDEEEEFVDDEEFVSDDEEEEEDDEDTIQELEVDEDGHLPRRRRYQDDEIED